MFSTEEVIELIKAHKSGDNELFDNTIHKLAKKSEEKGRMRVAKALRDIYTKPNEMFRQISYSSLQTTPILKQTVNIEQGSHTVSDVILSRRNSMIVNEILETWNNRKKLKDAGLSHSTKVLLYGLPGTGKTYLANALASSLDLPITQVDVSKLISSFLGETGKNVSDLFEGKEQQILFLDEFEALAKSRADEMDIGEAKRIVTSILQNIDNLSDDVLLVAATNHAEMIDTAIRRRFTYELNMDDIDYESRKSMYSSMMTGKYRLASSSIDLLAKLSGDFTGYDIYRVQSKAVRRSVLMLDKIDFEEQLFKQFTEIRYKKSPFNSKSQKDVKELITLIEHLWSLNKKYFTYDVLEAVTGISDATINYIVKKEMNA